MSVDVAVVGGGVTGLTVAHRMRDRDATVSVLEAGPDVGGMLRSVSVGGLRVPAGPDSFLARKPWAVDLCRELGIGDELIQPRASGSYLWTERGLVPYPTGTAFGIPSDLGDAFRWPGLSRAGRVRALRDLIARKRRTDTDESLGGLLRRRLGDEATDRAIAPLLAGLYAGDVDALSVRATFPELQGWERAQGSLLRGAQAATRNARSSAGPMFLRPRDGVERLIDALREDVGASSVRTSTAVTGLERGDADSWRVRTPDGTIDARTVILTVDAPTAARLVPAGTASAELARIPFVSTGVVALVYPEGTGPAIPDGSGFVVPRGAAPMTACTWISNKWPDPHSATVRCSAASSGPPARRTCSTPTMPTLSTRARGTWRRCSRCRQRRPTPRSCGGRARCRSTWSGISDRVARIRSELPAGIFVCGRSLDGVGVADCVRSAGETADAIAAYLDRGGPRMTDTLYALYPVFRADPEVRSAFADPEDRARATREVETSCKRLGDRVTLRGSYSTVGFRADADLLLWLVGLHRGGRAARARRVPPDRDRRVPRVDLVVHGGREAGGVQPRPCARVREGGPAAELPLRLPVRTHGRSGTSRPGGTGCVRRDHGGTGREFPEVVGNTTSAFGLGDWEWTSRSSRRSWTRSST